MSQKLQPPSERPDPSWEGTKTFIKSTTKWALIYAAVDVVFSRILDRGRDIGSIIAGNLSWNIGIASLFGAWDASKAYHETKRYNEIQEMKDLAEHAQTVEQLQHPTKLAHAQRVQAEKLAATEHGPETPNR